MTYDFNILSDANLDQVSGGATSPFVHPNDPSAPHGGWRTGQPPISAITLFNNPALYCRCSSTAKAF